MAPLGRRLPTDPTRRLDRIETVVRIKILRALPPVPITDDYCQNCLSSRNLIRPTYILYILVRTPRRRWGSTSRTRHCEVQLSRGKDCRIPAVLSSGKQLPCSHLQRINRQKLLPCWGCENDGPATPPPALFANGPAAPPAAYATPPPALFAGGATPPPPDGRG